jgi:hypothetical protein
MTARVKWIERRFSFDFPADFYPEIISRLRGTPARVEDLIHDVPQDRLRIKPGKSWSAQEHIGHLISVEELLTARLDDFEAGMETLTAADMKNKRTDAAGYNDRSLSEVLSGLRAARGDSLRRIEGYEPEMFSRTARHPRLDLPMRLVDALYFFAHHDDYHLARIYDLLLAQV